MNKRLRKYNYAILDKADRRFIESIAGKYELKDGYGHKITLAMIIMDYKQFKEADKDGRRKPFGRK